MIVQRAPASFNIEAETSPVNAPGPGSRATSCPATSTLEPSRREATDLIAVNGGARTISPWVRATTSGLKDGAKSIASAIVLYIFQFPAIIGFLITSSGRETISSRAHSFPLEQLRDRKSTRLNSSH